MISMRWPADSGKSFRPSPEHHPDRAQLSPAAAASRLPRVTPSTMSYAREMPICMASGPAWTKKRAVHTPEILAKGNRAVTELDGCPVVISGSGD